MEGAPLESITEWWIKCRLAAAYQSGLKSIRLTELFPMIDNTKKEHILQVAAPSNANYKVNSDSLLPLRNIATKRYRPSPNSLVRLLSRSQTVKGVGDIAANF